MDAEKGFTVVGAAVTTFLVVAVLVIERLETEFSAIFGLPIGVIVGGAVLVGLWVSFDKMQPGVRRAASAYAVVGLAVLGFAALRYVNIGRNVLKVDVILGLSIAAGVALYLGLTLRDRAQPEPNTHGR